MRSIGSGVLGVLFLLGAAQVGYAGCDPTGADKAAVDAARADVTASCPCDRTDQPTTNHGAYVSCAAGVAQRRSTDPSTVPHLPPNCKGFVKSCAAKSICGKGSAAVTCCIPMGSTVKCKTKRDTSHCPTDRGATVGTCASCCDACPSPGSGPTCS